MRTGMLLNDLFDFIDLSDPMVIVVLAVIGVLIVAIIVAAIIFIRMLNKNKDDAVPAPDYIPSPIPQDQREKKRFSKKGQNTIMPGAAPYDGMPQEPQDYRAPEPMGYQNAAPADYAQPEPMGYQKAAPADYAQPEPMSYQNPAPADYAQPEPMGYQNPAPADYAQPEPMGYPTPAPAAPTPYVSDDDSNTVLLGADVGGFTMVRKKTGERFTIDKNEFYIGKERAKVDFCVTNNNSVSRRHARIDIRDGKCYICDLGSTNSTYINGTKLSPHQEIALIPGDVIKLSNEEFDYLG